jgi:triacylglycerol lipase
MKDIELLYTFVLYGGLTYFNNNINVKSRKYNKFIEDSIIKYFLISFILYLCYYFYNICINKDENNHTYITSLWNQINTQAFLIISIFGIYIKYMPMNTYSLLLFGIGLWMYYPLVDLVVNYIYNGFYTPDKDQIKKAIFYSNYAYQNSIINPLTEFGYNVLLNKDDSSEIIICFRGTTNDKNKLSDLNILDSSYNINLNKSIYSIVNIHKGFLDAYLSVKDDIYIKCQKLLNNGATKIFITGHSLGGAVAKICVFDFNINNKLNISNDNISSVQIAAPTVGSNNFMYLYNANVKNTFEVSHINDPVPKLLSWYYKSTKNIYTLFSNVYGIDAHMLDNYQNCIDNEKNSFETYRNRLIIVTPIIIGIMYFYKKYYIRNKILYD